VADYTVVNLKRDVEDQAPKFGYAPTEARFARQRLELKKSGLSHFRVAPGFRFPFGHSHSEQEEIYVVTDGVARVKLDRDVVQLAKWDAVRIAPGVMRAIEAGPDGAELVAFGAPNTENADIQMVSDWWVD
jgi:quercetin dioxygenase-like cupin family protein